MLECSRCKKKFKPSLYYRKLYSTFHGMILCECCIQKQRSINDLLWQHKRGINNPNTHHDQDHTAKPKNLFQRICPKMRTK